MLIMVIDKVLPLVSIMLSWIGFALGFYGWTKEPYPRSAISLNHVIMLFCLYIFGKAIWSIVCSQ